MDRARDSGSRGWRFESSQTRMGACGEFIEPFDSRQGANIDIANESTYNARMKRECGVTVGEAVFEQRDNVVVNNSTAGSNAAREDMWARGFKAEVTVPIRCLNCPLIDEIVVTKIGMAPLVDAILAAQEEADQYADETRITCTKNLKNP